VEQLPSGEEVSEFGSSKIIVELHEHTGPEHKRYRLALHHLAKEQLESGHADIAWKILLQDDEL
jgi:hypothetical protein